MSTEYLFDSKGSWIAFKEGKYLFTPSAAWIGWFPWEDGVAVNRDGKYLGTVYLEDRLLVNKLQKKVKYPGYPGYPDYPGLPAHPGQRGYCGYLPNTEDVKSRKLEA